MKIEKKECPGCSGYGFEPESSSRTWTVRYRKFCLVCYGTGKAWPHVIEEYEMNRMAAKIKEMPSPRPKIKSIFI